MSRKNTSFLPSLRAELGDLHPGPGPFLERILFLLFWIAALVGDPAPVDCSQLGISCRGGARRHSVMKLRKPNVGFRCQPSSYVRLDAYGFFGLSEGA
jgi:hypothetical protein